MVVPQAVGVTDWGPLCQGEHLDEFIHVQCTEREQEMEGGGEETQASKETGL